jgi:hypothetical protein
VSNYLGLEDLRTSARPYHEAMHSGEFEPIGRFIDEPTGCAIFPKGVVRAPRAWAEHAWDLRRFTVMPRGGHFAAMEEPALLVDDIRAFFRDLCV